MEPTNDNDQQTLLRKHETGWTFVEPLTKFTRRMLLVNTPPHPARLVDEKGDPWTLCEPFQPFPNSLLVPADERRLRAMHAPMYDFGNWQAMVFVWSLADGDFPVAGYVDPARHQVWWGRLLSCWPNPRRVASGYSDRQLGDACIQFCLHPAEPTEAAPADAVVPTTLSVSHSWCSANMLPEFQGLQKAWACCQNPLYVNLLGSLADIYSRLKQTAIQQLTHPDRTRRDVYLALDTLMRLFQHMPPQANASQQQPGQPRDLDLELYIAVAHTLLGEYSIASSWMQDSLRHASKPTSEAWLTEPLLAPLRAYPPCAALLSEAAKRCPATWLTS